MIDKLGLDGLGGASVRVEPTPQEQKVTPPVNGQSKSAFTPSDGDTPAVVGLEPVHWYLENEDEYMSEKLRKEHERLNSYTFKLCKVVHPLYSAADVAKLQADLAAMTKKADGFFDALQLAAKINAEGQAREQQLREALELVKRDARHYIPHYAFGDNEAACEMNRLLENIEGYGDEALALPQDDTALRQWGAKLLRDLADKGWPAWDADDLRLKADELEAGSHV